MYPSLSTVIRNLLTATDTGYTESKWHWPKSVDLDRLETEAKNLIVRATQLEFYNFLDGDGDEQDIIMAKYDLTYLHGFLDDIICGPFFDNFVSKE